MKHTRTNSLKTMNVKLVVSIILSALLFCIGVAAFFFRPEYFGMGGTVLRLHTVVINNDGGSAVESDFLSTVTAEGMDPLQVRGSAYETRLKVHKGNFRIDPQSDSRYNVTLVGDCSGTLLERESKICTITYNDVPQKVVIDTKTIFKALALSDRKASFKPLEYTLERIEKINNPQIDQPAFFKNETRSDFDRKKYSEGNVAFALTVKISNLNESGFGGTNYIEPSMQNLTRITHIDMSESDLKPVQVIDASTIEPLSSKEVVAIFSIPWNTKSVTVALGYQKNPLAIKILFDERAVVITKQQALRQDLAKIPGCQSDEVSVDNVHLYRAGGEYLQDHTVASGENAYIEYTWKGGGDVRVTPAGTSEKIWGSNQAWTYIAPMETTTYTLTPSADPDCATTFLVNVR